MNRHTLLVGVLVAAVAACGPAASRTEPLPSAQPTVTPSPSPSPTTSVEPTGTPSLTPTPTRSRTPTATPSSSATQTSALPGWLRGHVVTHLPTTRHVVVLTFDGGAGAQGAASILATLAREHVPATFFLTGNFVSANPSTTRAIAAAGNVIGDHTVTHPHSVTLSSASLTREVTVAAERIRATTGKSPRPWFRFPYGEYDARTLRVVNDLGYGAIGWTVDTLGWEGKEAGSSSDVVRRVRAAISPGAIVLMHLGANPDDGTTYDADALPAMIAAIRAAGYGFVTVAG